MKISVIVPVYNKSAFLEETINSVLHQSYNNWELFLIDDNSTDDSRAVISRFHDERIFKIYNQKNYGANYCRNIGIKKSTGSYILFLDADDILDSQCIEKRVKTISNTSLDFAVFTMGTFFLKPGDSDFKWIPSTKNALRSFIEHDLPWQIMQPLWRKSFLDKTAGFDESFERLQDVEFHTRCLLDKTVKFQAIIDEPDCYYRISENRITTNYSAFFSRWLKSVKQYCLKFSPLLPESLRYRLVGTIFQTYVSLLMAKKLRQIDDHTFKQLEAYLFSDLKTWNKKSTLLIFNITKYYNLKLFRVPGLNRLLKKLIY